MRIIHHKDRSVQRNARHDTDARRCNRSHSQIAIRKREDDRLQRLAEQVVQDKGNRFLRKVPSQILQSHLQRNILGRYLVVILAYTTRQRQHKPGIATLQCRQL